MDDEPLLLSKGRKTIGPKLNAPKNDWEFVIAISLLTFFLLWKSGVPWFRGAVGYVLIACWIATVCYTRFLGIGYAFRFINRIAERIVNPPGPNPDDKPESS
ncbi:MAG: hypothetical protein HY290_15865 [Planctomycetia bacterium]|nr:hypothetical protein [Planctomycetia bacterium]